MTELGEDPATTIVSRLRQAADGAETVSVRDMIAATGTSSFAMLLFIVAALIVTPISAIPTVPTIGALLIGLIVGQWIAGRDHLWLPNWIMRRSVSGEKLLASLDWSEKPARFIDCHTHVRWEFLTRPPLRFIAFTLILAIIVTWPFLELLPLFTSVTACGILLISVGLATRDGLWMLAGYAYAVLLTGVIWWIV